MQFQEKYTIIQTLQSEQSFNQLFLVRRNIDQKLFMLKKVLYSKLGKKQKQQIVQQVNILSQITSCYLIKYYQHFVIKQQNTLYIIIQYQPNLISLQTILSKYKQDNRLFSQDKIWKLFKEIVLALRDIHRSKKGTVLHRNLQPKSVFITGQNIKLGNFRFVRKLEQEEQFATTKINDAYYLCPQQLQNGLFTVKSDIWALGCLLYEISTFEKPFQANNNMELARKIAQARIKTLPNCYKKELNRVIRWCLAKDPKDRPSVEDLLGIPMINLLIRQNRLTEVNRKIVQKEKRNNNLQKQICAIQQKIQHLKKKSLKNSSNSQIINGYQQQNQNSNEIKPYKTNLKKFYDLDLRRGLSEKLNQKMSFTRNLSTNSSQLTNYTTCERGFSGKGKQNFTKKDQNTYRHLNF